MSYTCFFYGTLLHPAVIKKVIENDAGHLAFSPAVLFEHTRHHVKNADYPALVPYNQSRSFFDHDLNREERCVRGSVVMGLSDQDMRLLDHFEGEMYVRRPVKVHPLLAPQPVSEAANHTFELLKPSPLPDTLPEPVDAEAYIWIARMEWLQHDLWDYETFVNEKLKFWIGENADLSNFEDEYEGPDDREGSRDVISQRKARRAEMGFKNSNSGY